MYCFKLYACQTRAEPSGSRDPAFLLCALVRSCAATSDELREDVLLTGTSLNSWRESYAGRILAHLTDFARSLLSTGLFPA